MEENNLTSTIPQYSLGKVLAVWAAAAVPMGLLGWVVGPALAPEPGRVGLERLAVLTVGLVWQFILVVILVYREAGNLRWAALKERLWLNSPRSPRTGEVQRKLWLWVIPLILVTAVYELSINDIISGFWTSLFPFLAEPPSFAMGSFLQSPESRAQLVGNWGALALFVVSAVFNTVLGEELLFRGLLLPRMNGRFGRWDWAANGLLFGVYHVHQPWNILNDAIYGCLFVGFPTKRFRSSWMGIVVHSGQSVFLTYLILGLVLGLA